MEQSALVPAMGRFVGQTVEGILGASSTRFFGEGYRRVRHGLLSLTIDKLGDGVRIHGAGAARYPANWSLDAAGNPRGAHLSSFDAIALTGASLRAAALHDPLSASILDARVSQITVRAPAQVQSVTQEIVVDCTVLCTDVSSLHLLSRVGRFRVDAILDRRSDGGTPTDLDLHDPTGDAGLGPAFVRSLTPPRGPLHVEHGRLQDNDTQPWSCVNELAMLGQLGQIAVYAARGVDRSEVPNLWLRALTLQRADQWPQGSFESWSTITRDRDVRIGEALMADIQLSSVTSYGSRATAAFAYQHSAP